MKKLILPLLCVVFFATNFLTSCRSNPPAETKKESTLRVQQLVNDNVAPITFRGDSVLYNGDNIVLAIHHNHDITIEDEPVMFPDGALILDNPEDDSSGSYRLGDVRYWAKAILLEGGRTRDTTQLAVTKN